MEVYGDKPKLFSKKWWENYFYYYKIHTIAGILILLAGGYIVYSDLTATKYDLHIDYISELGMGSYQTEIIEQLARENIIDVTGNEICDAFVMMLDMAPSHDMQYGQAMQVKYMTEQVYSEAFVFILSKQYAEEMSGCNIFEKADVWSGTGEDVECISLAGCKALENSDIPADDLFLAVRKLRDDEIDDEKKIAEHKNGMMFARFLIDER